jgi:magnesium transporter
VSASMNAAVGETVTGSDVRHAVAALNQRYLLDFPREAARQIERLPTEAAAALLEAQPASARVHVWESLVGDVATAVLRHWPALIGAQVLAEAEPAASAGALAQLEPPERERLFAQMHADVARELRTLLEYPDDVAGRLMDPRVAPLRTGMTVGEALQRLKTIRSRGLRELFIVDDEVRLVGRVEIQDLATHDDATPINRLMHPPLAVANDLDPREDFVEQLQQRPITELPVVALDGRFVGVIRQAALLAAVEQETSLDVQAMVGVSRDERALSPAGFAVRQRLPWLQINLLTAFLAASVVGLFEGTISKFTALAVLLPVVAGQSGNAGAQALAVTMRALALREITLRHWRQVVGKETLVGLFNGLAVALSTGVGVYVWSGSSGLVLVCMLAMVISMLAAGLAGALVPMLLRRFGQDPALASSIILTTVTDIVGFSSFLGIATLLSSLLKAG